MQRCIMITDHAVGVAQFMNRGILTTLAAASLAVRFGHVIRVRLDLSQGQYHSVFEGGCVVVNL